MFYVGLDLGQKSDPSALAVIEQPDPPRWAQARPVSQNQVAEGLLGRWVERVPLGTRYQGSGGASARGGERSGAAAGGARWRWMRRGCGWARRARASMTIW